MKLQRIWNNLKTLFSRKSAKRLPKNTRKKPKKAGKKLIISAPEITPKRPIAAITEFSLVQLSHHTQRAYKRDLHDFLAYLRLNNWIDHWGTISAAEVAGYRDHLTTVKGLAKSSVTRKIAVVKSFYKWAIAQNWVDRNPAELIRAYPQTQESKTGFLADKEIQALLSYFPDLRVLGMSSALGKVCVETLLMLGLRRSEAVAIRAGHLEFSDNRWTIEIQGKGDRSRRLPIPPRLQQTWAHWFTRINEEAPISSSLSDCPKEWVDWGNRHHDQPLLISTRASHFRQALSDSEVGRIIRKTGIKAGLINRLSPHMLRATAITHALDQGATHRGVQQMAGWTSPLMITRYDKRRNDPRHSAVHNLSYGRLIAKESNGPIPEARPSDADTNV
ncbi:tyrosine-type recombinase/integrase [bacterium]|nr:tyrosine-type recombinase/integrase [bacterium]